MVIGGIVLGDTDQSDAAWSTVIEDYQFNWVNASEYPSGLYSLGERTPDGQLIEFTMTRKFEGHPEFSSRVYSGIYIEDSLYLRECQSQTENCSNYNYFKIHIASQE